jgi:hypothetical protein
MKSRLDKAKTLEDPWETGKLIADRLPWGPNVEGTCDWEKITTWSAPDLGLVALLRVQSSSKNLLLRTPKPDRLVLTTLETGDDTAKFTRYFIAQTGLFKVLRSETPIDGSGQISDEDMDSLQDSMAFELEYGFIGPSASDRGEARKVLEIGYLDGTH